MYNYTTKNCTYTFTYTYFLVKFKCQANWVIVVEGAYWSLDSPCESYREDNGLRQSYIIYGERISKSLKKKSFQTHSIGLVGKK